MKKIIILLLLLFSISVNAKEDVLILEGIGKDYYYDRHSSVEEFHQDIKMNELKQIVREIEIQNNSDLSREIYLLFESKGEDGSYNDLMEYLNFKITLDDKTVYEGSGDILDFTETEDLYGFISLGKLKKKSNSHLKIEMELSEDYKTISNNSFAYITWKFYQKDKNKEFIEVEELTPNLLYNFLDVWVFCGVCVLFALLLLSLVIYKIKTRYKKKEKKEKKKKRKNGEEEENEKEEKS